MRSDFDRTASSIRLSMTSTFCRWIPFHGSSTKETEQQLEASKGAGSSPYVVRASYLPIYNYGEEFTHNKELDYDLMRRNYNEWKSVKHLLTKDMYVLTPWRHFTDRTHWTALAYDDPEIGESILLAFRMEEAESVTFTAKLPFADKRRKIRIKRRRQRQNRYKRRRGAVERNNGHAPRAEIKRVDLYKKELKCQKQNG